MAKSPLKTYLNNIFGKWVKIKNAPPEDQECIDFYSIIRKYILEERFNGVIFHVANEFSGEYKPVFGQVRKAMGKISGMSDYVVCSKLGNQFIEFKRPDGKGKQRKSQKDVQAWVEENDMQYHLVQTKEEALDILERYIIPR